MLKEGAVTSAFEKQLTLSLQSSFFEAFCFQPCLLSHGRMGYDDGEN
jgi:hypothetical protein